MVGCNREHTKPHPSIEFNKIPPAGEGGPDKIEAIEGHAYGALPSQQIVLFAKAGAWWVQPMSDQPFTKIQTDSSWKNTTHLGTEYAALLVDSGYRPRATMDALPSLGGGVAAIATVKGGNSSFQIATKTIQFSGYEWKVRNTLGERTGAPHNYDPANVLVDSSGFLHLRVSRHSDQWTCSEVEMTRSFGYGTYLFTVRDVSHLEPAAALSLFTWDELGIDQYHRELDIELSRWGDPTNKNAQYVVQPYYVPANVSRFAAPSGVLTHYIHWEPGRVSFDTVRGNVAMAEARRIANHVFTAGVPSPGSESVRMNLCAFSYSKVPLQNEAEVVIEKVQYLP